MLVWVILLLLHLSCQGCKVWFTRKELERSLTGRGQQRGGRSQGLKDRAIPGNPLRHLWHHNFVDKPSKIVSPEHQDHSSKDLSGALYVTIRHYWPGNQFLSFSVQCQHSSSKLLQLHQCNSLQKFMWSKIGLFHRRCLRPQQQISCMVIWLLVLSRFC